MDGTTQISRDLLGRVWLGGFAMVRVDVKCDGVNACFGGDLVVRKEVFEKVFGISVEEGTWDFDINITPGKHIRAKDECFQQILHWANDGNFKMARAWLKYWEENR